MTWYQSRNEHYTSPIVKGMKRDKRKPADRRRKRILSAEEIGASEGKNVRVSAGGEYLLPLVIRPEMPDHLIGLPAGLPGVGGLSYDVEVSVTAEGRS